MKDTIVAQATPPGRGGVAIVRVSGPRAKDIAQAVLGQVPAPRKACFSSFLDPQGQIIDQGLALFFVSPHSFTSEDVLELHGHGGPVIVNLLIQAILKQGARMARPGEFSERAFLNGKMDLTQAESVADLINASTEQAARSALRSLQGDFSKHIQVLLESLIYLRMYIEAAIDFAEEEIDFLSDESILLRFEQLLKDLQAVQANARQGSLLRDGIQVVIAGKPNVGKSTLLNLLCGKELAIVTDIPGTTRDTLREHIQIDGLPLHIIDTAGLRDTQDPIEQEGIRRARKEMAEADLLLYVTDDHNDIEKQENTIPAIIIRNKIDLLGQEATVDTLNGKTRIHLSAKENLGLDILKDAIKSAVGFAQQSEGTFSARARHLAALENAKINIIQALEQLQTTRAGELAAEDLRQAQKHLSEITGEFTTEDLLGRIFSSFCVGK